MIISNTVWVSQLKNKSRVRKWHDSIHTVRSLWLLSYSAVSRWMTCMCFNVWHSVTLRENQLQKCYWTKKQQKKKKKKLSWNWQEYSVYYSVVDTCCQTLHIAMVISKNKMWNTVSRVVLWVFLVRFESNWKRMTFCHIIKLWWWPHEQTTSWPPLCSPAVAGDEDVSLNHNSDDVGHETKTMSWKRLRW